MKTSTSSPTHIRLKQARAAMGMTQAQAACAVGIKRPNLAAMESGRRPCSEDMLMRVLKAIKYRPSKAVTAFAPEALRCIESYGGSDAVIFGSVADGTDNVRSDIDIAIRLPRFTSLSKLIEMTCELEEIFGVHVDVMDLDILADLDAFYKRRTTTVKLAS